MMHYRRRRVSQTAEELAANKAANLAKKIARAKRCATCQICGRAILANTGTIANHGYERPGDGWQTASCSGAKCLPYEVSKDELPPTIKRVAEHIERVKLALADFIANPPRGIETNDDRNSSFQQFIKSWTVLRPANFDPKVQPSGSYSMEEYRHSYARLFHRQIEKMQKDIKGSQETKAFFEDRLAKWTPVWTLEQWQARVHELNS